MVQALLVVVRHVFYLPGLWFVVPGETLGERRVEGLPVVVIHTLQ